MQTPGSFPDSAPSDNADVELLPAREPAGKQLEMTRTSIPPETKASNAVAQTGAAGLPANAAGVKPTSGQAISEGAASKMSTGQEIQQTQTDVPPETAKSNAAAIKVPGQKSMTPPVDPLPGQELQHARTDIPLKPDESKLAAKQAKIVPVATAEGVGNLASSAKPSLDSQSALSSSQGDAQGGRASIAVANEPASGEAAALASSSSIPPDVQQSNEAATQATADATAGSSASSAGTSINAQPQAPKQASAEGHKHQSNAEALDMQGAAH